MSDIQWICPECATVNTDTSPHDKEQPTVEPVCMACECQWLWSELGYKFGSEFRSR